MFRNIYSCVLLIWMLSTAALADAVFNLWIDAPAEVQAGSTFTFSVWGQVSGSVLNEGDGAMSALSMDLLAEGVSATFSEARRVEMGLLDLGTPSSNMLEGILGINHPSFFPFWTTNPSRLIEIDLTLAPGSIGTIELIPAPNAEREYLLAWWADYNDLVFVSDADPGSSRVITPATVNVIPAPGAAALLALAGLGTERRRR